MNTVGPQPLRNGFKLEYRLIDRLAAIDLSS